MHIEAKQQGFSLVELSIVLVILGLLTGGILAGQSLIRAAEIRSVTADYTRYSSATNTFRDKYFALPGDFNKATSFWGVDAGGCPGTSATTTGPGVATCNGNGNGILESAGGTANEVFRYWQHLASAGLIEGSFTGVSNSTTYSTFNAYSFSPPNVPKSRLDALWVPLNVGDVAINNSWFFDGSFGHVLHITSTSSMNNYVGGFMRSEEAWNMDVKMDDGKPGTGNIASGKINANTGCSDVAYSTTVSISKTSSYDLSNTNKNACSLIFRLGF